MLAGILLRLVGIFLVTALSAIVHAIGPAVQLGEIIFWRSAISLLPILLYMALRGQLHSLRTKHPGQHLVRGLLGAAAMAFSFLSLMWLPVANATAIGFLGPVLSLPLAALLLKERIGPRPVIAVVIGFAGMMVMVAHAISAPQPGQLVGVLAGLGFAFTMALSRVQIRAMTAHESTGAIAFSFALIAALCGLALAPPWTWTMPDARIMGLLLACGLMGGVAHIATTEAMARVTVSALAAFEFTGLIWAAMFDLLIFGTVLGPFQIAGMLIIVAAAVVVALPARAARGTGP